MSYLLIVVIGAVAGWIAGQSMKSDQGVGPDLLAGATGAVVAVFLLRLVGPVAAGGWLFGVLFSVLGAVGAVYAMRRFMKAQQAPAPRPRRRP